jgi:AGZA family xanthine/uracil permease-like MFS transporter
MPFRIPGALWCILAGVVLTAILKGLHLYHLADPPAWVAPGFYFPRPVNVFAFLSHPQGWSFLSVIVPMSLLDTICSLQILESVNVAGDNYKTRPSLLVNGLATILASCFGSAFPTIPYFGHMGYKDMGARSGYSVLSGTCMMLVCVTGIIPLVLHFVPLEVVAIIVVWFGLVMMGQAFTEVPKPHAIAVAFGLIPMLAGWALELVDVSLRTAGSSLLQCAPLFGNELSIYGLIALSQGALLTSMLWAAAITYMLDRRFLPAAIWMAAGAGLSCFGLIHAYRLTPQGVENQLGWWVAPEFTISYALGAVFLVGCHFYQKQVSEPGRACP